MQNNKKILEVDKLNKYFNKSGKLVKVLDNITFEVYEKDFLGIIGESGSGKSTTGKCIIRLYSSSSGNIIFKNNIINQKQISKKMKRWLYQNMSMIFQDPMSSLNPRKNVLSLISEPLIINKTIKNDALEIIFNCRKINSFFQNTYKLQDYELTNEFVLDFYNKNIELFSNLNEKIAHLNVSSESLEILKNILIDMETNYKSSLSEYSKYIYLIKKLYNLNLSKYKLNELETTEIKYQEALNEKNIKKQITKAPKTYWELRDFKNKLISDLKTFLNDNKIKYNEQNFNRLKAIKTKYNSEIKSLRQNASLTTSITENIYDRVSIQILKDTLKVVKLIDKDIYVEQYELEDFSNFINKEISEKYINLINKIHELGALSEQIDKLLESNENNENLMREKLINYNELYKAIDNYLKELKKSNPLIDNKEVKQAIEHLKNNSKQKESRIEYEEIIQKATIKDIKEEINKIKQEFIRSYDDSATEIYQQSKKNFKIAKMIRHEFDVQANEQFKSNNLPLIKEQKSKIKTFIKELNDSQKIFKSVILNKLKVIKKHLKEQKLDKNNDLKILMNEIKNKLESISAINFEIETYNQDLNLYRRLRNKNLLFLLLNYKTLEQSLTRQYVYNALNEVGLKNEHAYRYPHEFSGGQRQRIVIARALISKPKLVIADEPISALDVSIQAQVINIMKSLAEKYGITFLFIAHDLSMVRYTSNRLIILHKGRIVEKGNTQEVFNNPIHPYTKSLIKASPELSKIHINLASFSSKMEYDKDYSPNNVPEFFKVANEQEHYVFATKEQFEQWTKK